MNSVSQNKTIIYVDGFNLYYRAVKNTPYKWLDLLAAFTAVVGPSYSINKIKYFTARVKGKFDPAAPARQDAFLRALVQHIPIISIYFGHFLVHPAMRRLAQPPHSNVEVLIPEEKGSDVNLAVHLVTDAWLGSFDSAFIVSNDSDLAEGIRLVRAHHPAKKVGLIIPGDATRPADQLLKVCAPVLRLRRGVMAASQLPDPIPGTNISKPIGW